MPDPPGDMADRVVEEVDLGRDRRASDPPRGHPGEQRQILQMMYFDGKTQVRIADELGLPLGTVKSRTLLGMRRLRTLLDEESA